MKDRSLTILEKQAAERPCRGADHAAHSSTEFGPTAGRAPDAVSRREMLRAMAASAAMAAFSGCDRQPPEDIVPLAHADHRVVPGVPAYFATAMARGGYGIGVLAQSHTGRPVKLEGNPDHPASLGRTDTFTQAEILSLYDPDRSQTVFEGGAIATWDGFERALGAFLMKNREDRGAGLAVLTGNLTSPTVLDELEKLMTELPGARWHVHEPIGQENARDGARVAWGRELDMILRLDRADVVFSLDSDFFFSPPGSVRYARDFAARRRVERPEGFSRLYAVEPTPTITGSKADHRLAVKRSQVGRVAAALARELGVFSAERPPGLPAELLRVVRAAAEDLRRTAGRSLVVAGHAQPPAVHAVTHAINERLGNLGETVLMIEPAGSQRLRAASLGELAEDIAAHRVSTLIIIDSNPAYSAPAELRFADRLREVSFTVHMGLHRDETGRLTRWHLPMHHALESWGDVRAFDGTATIVQPLIAPLYASRSSVSLLRQLRGAAGLTDYERVREYWRGRAATPDFQGWWREALRLGYVPDSQAQVVAASLQVERVQEALRQIEEAKPGAGLEICFDADPTIWDGRYGNNAWLQELPKPLVKLTWDNVALISPELARRHGLRNEEVLALSLGGRAVKAPVWILPGQADDCVTLWLGYGRRAAGRVGTGRGYDAYQLRHSDSLWAASGATFEITGRKSALAVTQGHHQMDGRELVRTVQLGEFQEAIGGRRALAGERPSLFPPLRYPGNQWGMVIDLTTCIGCSACTIACQAENNIPVVGKQQVRMGREMHWIRVDSYFEGPADHPEFYHQPVPCMHCENAPCEIVCPVAATTHSHDGLNEMTYNRCIGTRYCSNNCPYKVRRFNFFAYHAGLSPTERMHQNPQVTVRARGVMEKCTYCVQRIRNSEIAAKRQGRALHDGELQTACQQVCPANAIIFGDLNDPESAVSRMAGQPHNYGLLADLNTRPRTTYLARASNPRPALQS